MSVVILAAGRGSRLMPLTKDLPKGLVKFNDKSIIDYTIENFYNLGIRDILIVTGYKSNKFKSYNLKKINNDFFSQTNMLYSLWLTKNHINLNEDLYISYSDIIFKKSILKKLIKSTKNISVVADKNWSDLWKIRYDDYINDVESFVSKNKKIIDIGRKTKKIEDIQAQYIGLIKVSKEFVSNFFLLIKKIKEKNYLKFKKMYLTDFLQFLINENIFVYPVYIKNGWIEIDSYDDYLAYFNKLNKNCFNAHFQK